MTKPIVVLSFNRPHYLDVVLRGLSTQEPALDGSLVHLFQDGAVDPRTGDRHASERQIEECVEIFGRAFPDGTVHRSETNLGITENYRRAEHYVFDDLDAPVAYFFEDDLEVTPHYIAALDTIWSVVEHEERIVLFSAVGPVGSTLLEQHTLQHELVPTANHWGYGFRRSHWRKVQPLMAEYYALVAGNDRARPHEQIQALYRRWGVPHPMTSHDAAYEVAAFAVGAWKVTSRPCLARNVGLAGENVTPEIYAGLGLGTTVLWPWELPVPECPSPDEIEASWRSAVEHLHRLDAPDVE